MTLLKSIFAALCLLALATGCITQMGVPENYRDLKLSDMPEKSAARIFAEYTKTLPGRFCVLAMQTMVEDGLFMDHPFLGGINFPNDMAVVECAGDLGTAINNAEYQASLRKWLFVPQSKKSAISYTDKESSQAIFVSADIRRFKRAQIAEVRLASAKAAAQKRQQDQEQKEKNRLTECTGFGFRVGTDAHAECVMQLAIAGKVQAASRREAEAYARLAARQAAAAEEEAAAEKRRREGAALIAIGGAIASGQSPLSIPSGGQASSAASNPTTSRAYKTCTYMLNGGRGYHTVGIADICPVTKKFGSFTGYLTPN